MWHGSVSISSHRGPCRQGWASSWRANTQGTCSAHCSTAQSPLQLSWLYCSGSRLCRNPIEQHALAIQRHPPTSANSITLKYLISSLLFSHAQMFKYVTYFMKHINAVSLHKATSYRFQENTLSSPPLPAHGLQQWAPGDIRFLSAPFDSGILGSKTTAMHRAIARPCLLLCGTRGTAGLNWELHQHPWCCSLNHPADVMRNKFPPLWMLSGTESLCQWCFHTVLILITEFI